MLYYSSKVMIFSVHCQIMHDVLMHNFIFYIIENVNEFFLENFTQNLTGFRQIAAYFFDEFYQIV